jgi:polar amino acid transport system permease protein
VVVLVYHFDWSTFWRYVWPPTAFHDPLIRSGLWVTIYMAVVAQTLGVLLGVLGAIGQMSRWRAIRWFVAGYLLYFRGTPVLVQLTLWYFGLAAIGLYGFPDLKILGYTIPGVVQAGIIGLGVNEGAYMTEIVRAGIISIDRGQSDAAKALGMTFSREMRYVVLPQATKVIIPPLGNEFNNMIKSTSLVVIIGGVELFNAFEQLNAVLFRPFELFMAVSLYYLVLTLIWGLIQSWIESRLGERKGQRPRSAFRRMILGDGSSLTRGFGRAR